MTQSALLEEGTKLNILTSIFRLANQTDITSATLHLSAEGQNGPVVADLLADDSFASRGLFQRLRADVQGADLTGPLLAHY